MFEKLAKDKSITAEYLYDYLKKWNQYKKIAGNENYIFTYDDPFYGKIPLRVFIPANYNAEIKTPVLLMLHGAVQLSSFDRVKNSLNDSVSSELEDDIFFNYFSRNNFIIIRPFADPKVKFSWVRNHFWSIASRNNNGVNKTYQTLIDVVLDLKQTLNIDDSKIFVMGHSDGSDGAFCMGLFNPTIFAGFVAYNSMLANLFDNIYLANVQNKPYYIVHSDRDAIRPIEQTDKIVEKLNSYNTITYKEYKGYEHFDKHLSLDLPFADSFITHTERNPFPKHIYWESNSNERNQCSWVAVRDFDISMNKAYWHTTINFGTYNKIKKVWTDYPYYNNEEGYALRADYSDNVFNIYTSRVKKLQVFINPEMVNLGNPIKIILNEKLVFNQPISPSKTFMIDTFQKDFDRQSIWVNTISLDIE